MTRSAPAGAAVARTPSPERRLRRWPELLLVCTTTVLGIAHALVVGRHYAVGSFDDDASYIMTARALAHGAGLAGTLPVGLPVTATYPPGFPLVLTPVAWVAGAAVWPYRALVLVFFALIFPLTWWWLRRAGAPGWLRAGVLVLLALNPVAATYATMVMAEAPFLVAFLGTVLLTSRWAAQERAWTGCGVGAVLGAASMLWLKQAGLGLVVGLGLWLLLRHRWQRAVVLLAGVAAAISPVLALRAASGTPLAGARYSSEIGGSGGLGAIPGAIEGYLAHALPDSVLPLVDVPRYVFLPLALTVSPLIVVGAVVVLRRFGETASVATVVYLAETLLYPFTNERRVILVLPVVLAWFLVGAGAVLHGLGRLADGRVGRVPPRRPLAVLGILLLAVPLAWQFDRDYLLPLNGQDTGKPLGSAYLGFVAAVTGPGDVVETGYLWTTSLGTGRQVARSVFFLAGPAACTPAAMRTAARQDGAGFAVDADWDTPHGVPSCRRSALDAAPWAVPLYRVPDAGATVWELIGPGTVHPSLVDAITGPGATATTGDVSTRTWQWSAPRPLGQVSVGAADAATGAAAGVALEWQGEDGAWHRVATAPGPVGPAAATPWLLWQPPDPVLATGIRVVVTGGRGVRTGEVHALGGGRQ